MAKELARHTMEMMENCAADFLLAYMIYDRMRT
jgi:hypothetical protein